MSKFDFSSWDKSHMASAVQLAELVEFLIMYEVEYDEPATDGEVIDVIADFVKLVKEGGDVPALLEKYDIVVSEEGE